MTGRPEGTGGGYDRLGPDDHDQDAWKEFTPWRPGDASTAGEAPPSYAGDFHSEGLYLPSSGSHQDGRAVPESSTPSGSPREERKPIRWSESSPRRYEGGERVQSTQALGGDFIKRVQAGTQGRVVERKLSFLGDERLTVAFNNGYVEENVRPDAVERKSWF